MADRQFDLSVVLSVVDKASADLKSFDDNLDGIITKLGKFATAGAFLGGVTTAFTKSIQASADQELAMKRLELTLKSNGIAWDTANEKINDWIDSLEKSTMYSDDQLIPALQKMMTYTNDTALAMQSVEIAMNMASTGIIDFDTAVRVMGQTINGNTEIIKRYVPELRDVNFEMLGMYNQTEQVEYIMGILGDKFQGMSDGEVKTLKGAMQNLGDAFDDMLKALSENMLPAVESAVEWFTDLLEAVNDVEEAHRGFIAVAGNTVVALGSLALGLAGVLNPYLAIGTAVIAVSNATMSYIEAQQKQEDENRNLNKTHEDLIQTYYDKIKALSEDLASETAGSEEYKRIWDLIVTYKKAIAQQEKDIEKEKQASILAEQKSSGQSSIMQQERISTAIILSSVGLAESQVNIFKTANEKIRQDSKFLWLNITANWEDDWETFDRNVRETAGEIATFLTTWVTPITTALADVSNAWVSLEQANIDKIKQQTIDAETEKYNAEYDRISTTVEDEKEKNAQLENLESAHNKELAKIQREAMQKEREAKAKVKNLMILEAIANTSLAVTKALGSAVFPVNLAVAGLVLAKGVFEIERIKAQEFASGVKNFVGGMAWVGEQGKELVQLPQGSNVYSHSQSMAMAGAGGLQINLDINGNYILNEASASNLADIISDVIIGRVKKERLI